MSYYILPKNTNKISINPVLSSVKLKPYVSFSFLNYYLEVKRQIIEMFVYDNDLSDNTFEDAIRIINPYEFIFSKVPGSKFSVSKLKPNTNLFYDIFEIVNNFILFDAFKCHNIKSLHISPNYNDSIDCCEMFREGYVDTFQSYNSIDITSDIIEEEFDFIFLEATYYNENEYIKSLVTFLIILLRNQKTNGNAIIKVKDILYKPVLDCLYLLTSFYEKVYIAKPNTNNIASIDRYIICKSFYCSESFSSYLRMNLIKMVLTIKKNNGQHIQDILGYDIPYYFKNKIDELNIIIGQQQIESLDQIIAIFKNKNKNDKIESIKKSNIQKSVSWCEKHKIPCNKFTEKINIFLPIVNET